MIKLRYLGRALAIYPGEVGKQFQKACTVARTATEMDWENRRTAKVADPVPLFWYEEVEGRKVFCTLSGYGPRIERELRKAGHLVEVENFVDHGLARPDLSLLRGVSWRTGQKEVLAKLFSYDRGIIVCPTGWGKSFLIKLLAQAYPKAMIVVTVNSNDIAREIYDALKYDLRQHLGRVGDGKNDYRRVSIVTSQSLHKIPKDANLILADECHTLMTENYVKTFNKFRRAKIFGFTASPTGRSDNGEGFGEALFGPVIANVTYQEAVKAGNILQLSVRVFPSPLGPDVSKIMIKANADRRGIWLNEDRNTLIARVVRDLEREIGDDQQLLIMVDKTMHAYALGQLLPNFAIVTGEPTADRIEDMRKCGAMTPDQEPCTKKMRAEYKRQFESFELKRAISTKIWSKGVNFHDLAVLVRADGSGSPIDANQVPGRLSRLGDKTTKYKGLLVDFFDTFSPNLENRSRNRIKAYRQLGFDIENLQ